VLDRNLLFLAFFYIVFLYLLYQFVLILSPFVGSLLGAIMLTVIFHPLHSKLHTLFRNPELAAGMTTTIVLLTIVVPVLLLLWALINEATTFLPIVRNWITEWETNGFSNLSSTIPAPLQQLWDKVYPYIERWNIDLSSMVANSVRELGNTFTSVGAATVRQFFKLVLNIIILILMLFFFFRDGERITRQIIDLVPMEEENKQLILRRLERTLVAIIRGGFITASAQGLMTGIGLAVAGVPFAVLFGFTGALCSIVPFVGASLVWAPAALYLLLNGHIAACIGLVLWGLFVVGLIDNFLRPWVVGTHAQLPILLLLVGILGGLQVYGIIGALVSPLVVVTVLVFAQIYHDQYLLKQPAKRDYPDVIP
jgi:predicted PurR-regulated permease PerM